MKTKGNSKSDYTATHSEKYFFNTTHETGEELKECEEKASTQDDRVYFIFIRMQQKGLPLLSASEVLKLYPSVALSKNDTPPLTSIRRAISNLSRLGKLEKTDNKIMGPYGRYETQYRIPIIDRCTG